MMSKKMNEIKSAKKRRLRIYDEIESKDLFIEKNKAKIKKIKSDSIKELIYTNQSVPKNWRRKKNYQNQIYEIFKKNPKFLLYIGKGYNTYTENKSPKKDKDNDNNNSSTNDINKENNIYTNLVNKKKKNAMKKLSLSPISENPLNKNEIFYAKTTPNKNMQINKKENSMKSKEVMNFLDELGIIYPIKDKLNDLFAKEEIEKINMTNNNYTPIINERIRKQVFRNNVYLNLITSYDDKKGKTRKNFFKDNFNNNINISKMKREMIKNPLVLKKLERINFYGPHYSYCSQCGIKNIDFYQRLPIKQLNKITNEIRRYRNLI